MRLSVNPEDIALFGGLSGATVSEPIELVSGILIEPTYAHIFSHFLAAFNPPPKPRGPHPGPWHAVNGGGRTFDIHSQIILPAGVNIGGLSRINSLWLIISLIRLLSGVPVRMPAISSIAFGDIASSDEKPILWAVEAGGRPDRWTVELSHDFCRRLLDFIPRAAKMMDQDIFNRSYQSFDAVIWLPNPTAQMIAIWTAMETAMRPGRGGTTKRLADALRSYLGTDRSSGDRIYNEVVRLYGERGNSAHDAQPASAETVRASYLLAREMFIEIISREQLPCPGMHN